MLLIQTAFDQETRAILRAGRRVDQAHSLPVVQIGQQGCIVLETGMGPTAASATLKQYLESSPASELPQLLLSIGLAGGLRPDLPRGSLALIESVRKRVDSPVLRGHLRYLHSNLVDRMSVKQLITIRQVAFNTQAKQELALTGADLCDMETYAIAEVCEARQIPWVGARIVSDAVDESIEPWITRLPGLIAQKRWLAVVQSLVTHPQDVPGLLRLARRMKILQNQLTELTIDLVSHVLPTRQSETTV